MVPKQQQTSKTFKIWCNRLKRAKRDTVKNTLLMSLTHDKYGAKSTSNKRNNDRWLISDLNTSPTDKDSSPYSKSTNK
jgi:hypothetical protein